MFLKCFYDPPAPLGCLQHLGTLFFSMFSLLRFSHKNVSNILVIFCLRFLVKIFDFFDVTIFEISEIQQCFFSTVPRSVPYGVKRLCRAGKDIRNYRTPLESWEMIELEYTFHLKKTAAQSDFSFRRYTPSKVHHRGIFRPKMTKFIGNFTSQGTIREDFGVGKKKHCYVVGALIEVGTEILGNTIVF